MSDAHEILNDGTTTVVVNTTEHTNDIVMQALSDQHPEVASLIRWTRDTRRVGGLIERDKFVTPKTLFDQMRVAQEAVETDDVVAGVVETTEALTFGRMSVESDDEDEEDIWNQIIEDIDLDMRIREMWRELFTVSQFYCATWWGVKSYKVRGKSKDGVRRKKEYRNLKVPISISLLDPLKVLPVGNFMFNQERLAWLANRMEAVTYDNVLSGREQDATISRLLESRYEATPEERVRLSAMGLQSTQDLFLMRPDNVWRLTATRPQYKPFAEVRLKSVFELIDMKHLLREMERAHLLGATNFIVLVRKGSDQMPAKNAELNALQGQIRTLSRVPVIVGDHRLTIEIITPKIDMLLQPEKHNTIDARITARLFQMFMTGNFAAGAKGDDSMKLVRIVARGLEARRSLIRKAIQKQVLAEIWDRNDSLIEEPSLNFHPHSIAIDFDPGLAAYFLDLLDRKHISRGTVLEQIDLDEDEEAQRREREKENYDDIFESLTPLQDPQQVQDNQLEVMGKQQDFQEKMADKQGEQRLEEIKAQPKPTDTPNTDPKSAGRSGGGNRKGGGAAPGSGQGQTKDARRGAKG